MAGAHNLSKDFFELIKDIGESKSKQEEDKIIQREIEVLKGSMPAPNIPWKKMKEFLVRLLYVEMLGHDGSFGYIHAVNLTSSRVMIEKRTGYLAVSLMLHQDHDLILLLIANIQRDMGSSNFLEVSAALTAVMKLVNADTAPAILDNLMPLFNHSNELIRKKAVMAAHAFHSKSPSSVAHLDASFRKCLCDKDPGVMGASLHLLFDMAKQSPDDFKDLVPSYVAILRQIVDHRLPKDYDYHRMPAPWIQIKILQCLALGGADEPSLSEQMYEVLHEVLKRADMGINVGYAVMYECVRTVTSIYPNIALLDAAANSISRFITSDNHNLKYLGIKSLAAIVQINSKYAHEHQMIVVDCLDDHDETLKRKTLDLLFKMTTPQNVVFIAGKLMDSLQSSNDPFLREELVSRVTELAERFAPDNRWFIQTMNAVFEIGGDMVRPEIAHNLMRLIAEGTGGEDEEADNELRIYAVREYFEVLSKPQVPELFLQLVCWVLGEYSYVAEEEIPPADLSARLCDLAERPFEDTATRCYIIGAITKIVAQTGLVTSDIEEIANKYSTSKFLDLAQRCNELLAMMQDPSMMAELLPMDASTEDLEPDEQLGFLDDFIEEALQNGARDYDPGMADMSPRDREIARLKASKGKHPGLLDGMRLDAYDKPTESTMLASEELASVTRTAPIAGTDSSFAGGYDESGELRLGGAKQAVWGSEGFGGAQPEASASSRPPTEGWAPEHKMAGGQGTPEEPPSLNHSAAGSTFSSSGFGQHVPPAAVSAESEEQRKKKAMANQLFGGEPEPASTAVPVSVPGRSGKKEKKEKKEKKDKKDKKEKKSKKDKKATATSDHSDEEPKGSGVPAAVVMPVDDLDDLLGFGGPMAQASVPVVQAAAPASAAGPVDDLMDLLGPSTVQAPPQGLLRPGGMAAAGPELPPRLRSEFSDALEWKYEIVASDSVLEVMVGKILLREHMCVLITVSNKANSIAGGATVQVDAPKNFRITCGSEPPADIQHNRVSFSAVPERGQVHVVAQLDLVEPSPNTSAMRGQVSYMGAGGSKSLSFQVSMSAADLLRPAPFSTQEFGQTWESLGDGSSLQVRSQTIRTPAEFMARVSSSLHLQPVETIQQECICAGCLVGTQVLLLLHAEVESGVINITCNSTNATLSAMVARTCAVDFK